MFIGLQRPLLGERPQLERRTFLTILYSSDAMKSVETLDGVLRSPSSGEVKGSATLRGQRQRRGRPAHMDLHWRWSCRGMPPELAAMTWHNLLAKIESSRPLLSPCSCVR